MRHDPAAGNTAPERVAFRWGRAVRGSILFRRCCRTGPRSRGTPF